MHEKKGEQVMRLELEQFGVSNEDRKTEKINLYVEEAPRRSLHCPSEFRS